MPDPNPLKSPKLFLRFWLEAFKEAFGKGWGVSGAMSLAIPDAIIVVGKMDALAHLAFVKWVSENPNLARLYCVAIVVLLYLIYAPYRKYKETQIHAFQSMKKAWERLNVLGEENKTLRAQLDHENQIQKEKRRRNELATKLAMAMDKGRDFVARLRVIDADNPPPTQDEIDKWWAEIYMALSHHPLSAVYIARFNMPDDPSAGEFRHPEDRTGAQRRINCKLPVLGEFVKELMQPS